MWSAERGVVWSSVERGAWSAEHEVARSTEERGIHTQQNFWKTLFRGVFAEQSLGSQLKFSAGSARPSPCHTQSTAAYLCSMQGRFLERVRGALPQDLLTSPPGLLHDTLVSPVLHVREIFRRVQGSASPGFAYISPRIAPWHPCLACAPREEDSLEEDHLPTYSVVTFWQGEYTHN